MAFILPFAMMGLQAVGSIMEGNSANAQAQQQAAIENRNADIATKNAEITNQQYGQREDALRREGAQKLGAMRAAIGQSGTGTGGSNADVYGQSGRNLEMDALNLRYAGQLEATGLLNDAAAHRYNAAADKAQGKSAKLAGYIRAGTSLLSGPSGKGWGGGGTSVNAAGGYSGIGYGSTWGTGRGLAAAGYP